MKTKYGMLTVLEEKSFRTNSGKMHRFFRVMCDCGNEKWTHKSGVLSGNTVSCGCKKLTEIKQKHPRLSHGHATKRNQTRTYRIWCHIKRRCFNKNSENYPQYGGSGISMDPKWFKFEQFLKDMGECPEGLTIDRKNGALGYSKENCRWATNKQQANNRKSCKYYSFRGVTKTMQEWADSLGFKYGDIIRRRLIRGWSLERALTTKK